MRNKSVLWAGPALALLLGSGGCSNTVRYLSAMQWLSVPAGPAGSAAPAAPATPAGSEAPAAAAADGRTLYVTYWEGTCSAGVFGIGRGCSLGDSKIRRCNLRSDNLLECVDEAEANRAFARKK